MTYKESMPQEMGKIANALLRRTKAGEIQWEITDEDTKFLFTSTRSSALVFKDVRGPNYGVALLNAAGTVVTTYSGRWVNNPETKKSEPNDSNKMLEELYYAARTNALMIESTVKDIYGALGIDT